MENSIKLISSKTDKGTRKKHRSKTSMKEKSDLWGKFFKMEMDTNDESEPKTALYSLKQANVNGIDKCVKEYIETIVYANEDEFIGSGERSQCSHCNSSLEYNEDGFLNCRNKECGVMYRDMTIKNAEWRHFSNDDGNCGDQTRCGMPVNPLLMESSFGCKVLAGKYSHEMRKLRRYTEWQSMPYKEKSQYDEFQLITTLASNGGLPKIIIDNALMYHKKISEKKTYRGMNRDGIIAASVYIACRNNNYPRTSREIAIIFNLDNASATRGCKNAISILNEMETNIEQNEKTVLCMTKPSAFIPRFCSRLQIPEELTKLCEFIALRVEKNNMIPENTPNSIAAGIIYFIVYYCNLGATKTEISDVSEISEVTINKCYKRLEQHKQQLLPSAIVKKYNIKHN